MLFKHAYYVCSQRISNITAEVAMQIDIQTRGFSLTDALYSYSQRRVLGAMAYISGHVNRVVIRLSDINGPRGGADKCCRIQIALAGIPAVVVEDTEVNMYDAIDRAVDRARRTVVRKVDRQLTLHKQREPLVFDEE
jgi:ribosome-associated translation inhibitor RaiA